MHILIIGGTRNMGHQLTLELLQAGHRVTLLNRGLTQDDLPPEVERLRADRTEPDQLRAALRGRSFDAVVDMVLFSGAEAEEAINLLRGHMGHYIFISTGQVYLVREGLARPFSETDYEGLLMPAPKPNTYGYEEWSYGYHKREAEDTLAAAWHNDQFPYTSLRIPMVNGERDPMNRLYGYILRIKDGGPILVPETPNYSLRHVYAGDVVRAVMSVLESGKGKGQAYNVSQDETIALKELLDMLAEIMDVDVPNVIEVKRSLLEADGLLPDCSPFSDRWMSELTNDLGKQELSLTYTPLRTYLERVIQHYTDHPPRRPASYSRRNAERNLILQ